MLFFVGTRDNRGASVCLLDDKGKKHILPQKQALRNHSPDGFEWGYPGSGPSQLALAMLAYVSDDETALKHYMEFKNKVIAGIESNHWEMKVDMVRAWLERVRS